MVLFMLVIKLTAPIMSGLGLRVFKRYYIYIIHLYKVESEKRASAAM